MAAVAGRDSSFIEAEELAIRVESDADATIISLYGELDLASANAFETAVRHAEGADTNSILLDLSGLDFIDSSGLAILVRAAIRSRQDSNRLALLRGRDQVQRLLEVTGLAEELPFID